MIYFIFILIIMIIVVFWMFSNMISLLWGSPYVLSDPKSVTKVIKKMKSYEDFVFYELGSGSGDNLVEIEREFHCQAVGVEISPLYYLISLIKTRKNNNIKVKFTNILKVNLSGADIVYCYLYPKMMNSLEQKFQKELKKGAIVISNSFEIFKKTPKKIENINGKTIYIYQF